MKKNSRTKKHIKKRRYNKGGNPTRRMLPHPGGPDMYEDEMPVMKKDDNSLIISKINNLGSKVRELIDDEKEIRQSFLLMNEAHEEIRDEIEKMKTENEIIQELKREIEELKKQMIEDREETKRMVIETMIRDNLPGVETYKKYKFMGSPERILLPNSPIKIYGLPKDFSDKYDMNKVNIGRLKLVGDNEKYADFTIEKDENGNYYFNKTIV